MTQTMRERLIAKAAAFLMPSNEVEVFAVGEFDGNEITYIDYGPISVSGLVDVILEELNQPDQPASEAKSEA